ncbi:MAG: hypothetical protein QOG43_1146 [Actinomycetota bacterium]|jgi:putative FmdB family regulatory protein|nr:hypothetical protein [Actinomycetota bacterium]
MPKYEYACKSCGERIEVKQSFTDDALTECPSCRGPLRKVFSSPGIVLRGPGFYRTDHRSPYRPDGTRPAEPSKDREPAEAKSGSQESSDSKSSPDSKDSDSKGSDSKGSDSRGSDSKPSADAKGGSESKASESKANESKASEPKSSRESESRSAPSRRTARDISAPGSGSSKEPAGSGGSSGDTGGSKDTARTA